MTDLSTTVMRRINAPAERVFNAWLDPKMLARFMCPAPGVTVPRAETEARVGGRFDIVMHLNDKDIPHWGTYSEISPHEKLVFTWESPFSVEGSTVTLTFAQTGDATDVTLVHVKFPSEESRENHTTGWTRILEVLDAATATETAA